MILYDEAISTDMGYCDQCNAELVPEAKFCSNCGSEVSLRHKLSGLSHRLKYQTVKTIDQFKQSLDNQITTYLKQLNSDEDVRIAGIRVPESRRAGVRNAMESFQNKFLEGNPLEEAEYNQWIADLPKRLENHNCIVCFSSWDQSDSGKIVVCPHCNSGGHEDHLSTWIKNKNYCPLCRERVSFSEFIRIT